MLAICIAPNYSAREELLLENTFTCLMNVLAHALTTIDIINILSGTDVGVRSHPCLAQS